MADETNTVPRSTITGGDVPVVAEIPGTGDDGEPTEQGSLVLSVHEGALDLGEARNAGDRLRLTGELPTVTVTDSRAGSSGWNVTGTSSDLHAQDDEAIIRPDKLGWLPFLVDGPARPGPHVRAGLSGGPGLARPAVLVSSDGEQGPATLAADVTLEPPTAPRSAVRHKAG